MIERFGNGARPRPRADGRYTHATVLTAVVTFDFDPYLRAGDVAVRLETLAIAAVVLLGILVAAVGARAMDLRQDDLLFVVLGIVPGAVVGGRLGYVLLHPEFFTARPAAILDPGIGSLELTLGVAGGALTGTLVAALLEGSVGRWLHIATMPTLLALAAGKLAMVLGGSGQGQPTGEPFATAFAGPGPWGSLAPEIPSHPSQLYEAGLTLGVFAIVALLFAIPGLRRPDGRAFLIGLALWAVVRLAVASTWRDPVAIGGLRIAQVLAAGLAISCLVLIGVLILRERPTAAPAATG